MNCGWVNLLKGLPQKWERNGMDLLTLFANIHSTKDISEAAPHYTQCFLTLGIALERYLLICHAAAAYHSYNGIRRVVFYLLFTAAFLIPSMLPIGEVAYFIITHDSHILYTPYHTVKNSALLKGI